LDGKFYGLTLQHLTEMGYKFAEQWPKCREGLSVPNLKTPWCFLWTPQQIHIGRLKIQVNKFFKNLPRFIQKSINFLQSPFLTSMKVAFKKFHI